jgi:uncharacterized phage-associated protein
VPYPSIEVANKFIQMHGASGEIDPMKLQKLLYFANGWHLAMQGTPLLDELPQVWRYGPVFATIYRAFNRYQRQPILQPEQATPFGGEPRIAPDGLTPFLEWVWNEYGHRTGPELSDETHKPGTPWRQIAEEKSFQVPQGEVIPMKKDWEYFSSLAVGRGWTPVALGA